MADAKAKVEYLVNEMLPFAEEMLSQHGEFLPYGAALNAQGEVVSIAGHTGDEHPPSQEVIDLLRGGFSAGAREGSFDATALYYDVRIKTSDHEVSDAVAIELDHKDGYSVVVFFPYTIESGEVSFGEISAQEGKYGIFGSPPNE